MVYTLPRAIKEKKKKEEGVGHSGVEKEKEKNSRGVWQQRRRVSVFGSEREPRARGEGF